MLTNNFWKCVMGQIGSMRWDCVDTSGARFKESSSGYYLVFGSDYFQCPNLYNPRFLHTTATFNSGSASNGSNNNAAAGVYFGSGNTPPSSDDFTFSGEILHNAEATASVTKETTENGIKLIGKYNITNTGAEAFTIAEIGLVNGFGTKRALFDRTVLDEPVTIPAGGVGQVVYTITFNYPAATT